MFGGGRHAKHIFVALVAALFMAAPASADSVSITSDPATASAPAPFTIYLDADPPINASWTLLDTFQGVNETLGNGIGLPATLNITLLEAGDHLLVLHIDGMNATAAYPIHVSGPPGPFAYDTMIAGDVLPLLFAGTLMLVLAGWLLLRDRTRPINIAFATLFIARGIADIVSALWANHGSINIRPVRLADGSTSGVAHHLHPITNIVVLFAALYFLYAYLAQNNARLAIRHRVAASATAIGAFSLIALYVLIPGIWWQNTNGVLVPHGWLFSISGMYYPLYAVFALLLFRESVKDLPDDRRTGAFYSGLGLLFLPVFTGAGELLFVDILDFFGAIGAQRSMLGVAFEVGHWAAVLALIPVALAGVTLVGDALRNPARRGARLHVALYAVAVLLPLTSLAIAGTVFLTGTQPAIGAANALSVFTIFQGIWTIPYPVLVAYGITRYQASTDQRRMRDQLRRFGLASVFFTVFFAVSEGLEAFASSRFGPAVGLGSAAGLTLILGPLQERLQKKVVHHEDPEDETHQELKFYREQVRRTLTDGHIGDVERKFLLNLQDTMGITAATAQQIEDELSAAHGSASGPATAA